MLKLMLPSHTLSELTSAIQVESEAAQANFKAVRSMCGLASLPAELLACVFDYVVSGDPKPHKSISLESGGHTLACLSIFSGYGVI